MPPICHCKHTHALLFHGERLDTPGISSPHFLLIIPLDSKDQGKWSGYKSSYTLYQIKQYCSCSLSVHSDVLHGSCGLLVCLAVLWISGLGQDEMGYPTWGASHSILSNTRSITWGMVWDEIVQFSLQEETYYNYTHVLLHMRKTTLTLYYPGRP